MRGDVLQIAGRLIKYARVVRSKVTHGAAIFGEVDVPSEASSEGGRATALPVRFVQWYGFRVLPPVKAQVIVVAPRGGPQAVVVGADEPSDGPTDLEPAEPVIFDRAGSVIRFYSEGSLRIASKSGASVVLDKDGAIQLTSNEGATVELDKDGAVVLVSKAGAAVKLTKDDTTVEFTHPAGRGDTPTAAVDPGGALGAAGIVADGPNGTDACFDVTVQSDPMTVGAPGEVVTITFAEPWTRAPRAFIQPVNDDAALGGGSGPAGTWYYSSTTTELKIKTTATLQSSTTYRLAVWVCQ